jgi:hypothetical protein
MYGSAIAKGKIFPNNPKEVAFCTARAINTTWLYNRAEVREPFAVVLNVYFIWMYF